MTGLTAVGRMDWRHDPRLVAGIAAVALCLALQAWLALVTEFNWDEYFYLSNLYAYDRGELTKPLQSFQVHLLGWLTKIQGDEIDQLQAGRLVMLLCETATCALIYRLARTFFDPVPAVIAVLSYVSAGFTMMHGPSFRADPLAAALIMTSLTMIGRERATVTTTVIAALSAAMGLLVTLKVALYAPAFAGLALWRLSSSKDRRGMLRWLAITLAATIALLVGFYALQLHAIPKASNTGAQAILGSAGRATLIEAGLLPRGPEILRAALLSPFQTILLITGVVGAGSYLWKKQGGLGSSAFAALACAASLLCLIFYRNAFPYFFAFILPPGMLAIGWLIHNVAAFRKRALLLIVAMTVTAVAIAAQRSANDQRSQQQLLTAVHRIFPQPVPYIDRNGIISSFPKRGFFMSTWGLADYRKRPPIFEQLLTEEIVPLLILDSPTLEQAVGLRSDVPEALWLHAADSRMLRQNYIPHWGVIWVAGQSHRVGPTAIRIQVRIPGTYTVEGAAVWIDGKEVPQGTTVELARGTHMLRTSSNAVVTLRWGNRLYRPAEPPPEAPIYRGF